MRKISPENIMLGEIKNRKTCPIDAYVSKFMEKCVLCVCEWVFVMDFLIG